MLLSTCINLLMNVLIIANLNRMAVITKMNAGPLACIISTNVKDPCIAQCYTLGQLIANLEDESGSKERRPSNGKGLFGEAIKFYIIHKKKFDKSALETCNVDSSIEDG